MKTTIDWAGAAAEQLRAMREQKPLVHNITNFVVMNFTANVLLSAGASPVMAHAPNEVEEMAGLAGALVLNIGTLEDAWVAAMLRAGRRANELGVPVVVDPVGAGATVLRTETVRRLLGELRVALLRGNASEVLAVSGGGGSTRGVDSSDSLEAAAAGAKALASRSGVPVAVTGAVDYITDGSRVVRVASGHPLMEGVTGTGCGLSSLMGAYLAVERDAVSAAAGALAYYCVAGERAADGAAGPGSFMIRFLDELHTLTPEQLRAAARVYEE